MNLQDPRLKTYAQLTVAIGANVQPGEPVLVRCPVDAAPFARLLTEEAYAAGASEVSVLWHDDRIDRLLLEKAPLSVLSHVPQWAYDRSEYEYKRGANIIHVLSTDPENLDGIDMARIATQSKAHNKAFKPLEHYVMADEVSWTIVSVPNRAWAQKIFPDKGTEEAIDALWEAIFSTTLMNETYPIAAWKDHIQTLERHAEQLNALHLQRVHYRSSNGTDLSVRLPEGHLWLAAQSTNAKGTPFLPNIPTEEVFSMPHREGVDGMLVATKPLSYNGKIIDEFRLKFEHGAVVDFWAKRGGEALKSLLEEDPNARRLGEIALVPYDSPISLSGILFYNTLFDENASCHFAFGASYPKTIAGGEKMTVPERMERGANDAMLHEDFMVGTRDLSIVGTTKDGRQVEIFRDGNFAF